MERCFCDDGEVEWRHRSPKPGGGSKAPRRLIAYSHSKELFVISHHEPTQFLGFVPVLCHRLAIGNVRSVGEKDLHARHDREIAGEHVL